MSEDNWNIDCSDDEYKDCHGPWEPSPEIINKLYESIEKGETLSLKWTCPGYRAPSPEVKEPLEQESDHKQMDDKSDFDFMDETNTPKLKIRKHGEDTLKGSAKKKTTSLDGVINNMRRHNLLPPSQNASQS